MGRAALVLALVVAGVLAGCSGDDDEAATSAVDQDVAASDAAAGSTAAGATPLAVAAQPVPSRLVVRTASLAIETDEVDAAARRAGQIALGAGGSVFAQDTSLGEVATSTVTLKVPPDRLSDVLDQLAGLGEPTARTIGTDDVTDTAYDLDGRIRTAETSVERLRTFLSETTDVGQVTALEGELTRREAELEVLLGQRRSLQEQVDLATITLTVRQPPTVAATVESIPGVGRAFNRGLEAFWFLARAAAVALAFLLPFAATTGALAWVAWRVSRRIRHRPHPRPAESA